MTRPPRRPQPPSLRSGFVGDIHSHEWELSWIGQPDLAPLVAAFPRLEELAVRGAASALGGELSLHVPSHGALRSLTIQSGGLPGSVAREVASSGLPALEHLELWLGVGDYGGSTWPRDLGSVLSGEAFPELRYLGVRNAESPSSPGPAWRSTWASGWSPTPRWTTGTPCTTPRPPSSRERPDDHRG